MAQQRRVQGGDRDQAGWRPRVAWFSPRSQDAERIGRWSSSAYTTETLLPLLQPGADITLFYDGFEPDPRAPSNLPARHFLTAAALHREQPFDVFFYHLEDHRLTSFARMHLGLKPGVVWFHDFLLTDDGPEPILNSPWERVVARYHSRSVPWPERAEEFKRPRPWAVREAGIGGIPIFSNEKDLGEFHRIAGPGLLQDVSYQQLLACNSDKRPAFFIPYPVPSSAFKTPILETPRSGRPVRLGLCASARIEYRVPAVLEALGRANSRGASVTLVWMVPTIAEQQRAQQLAQEFGVSSLVQTVVGATYRHWQEIVPSLDLALHLHFSVFGQPGPSLALSMAAGVPVAITDFGASDYLPAQVLCKIQPGIEEVGELSELFMQVSKGGLNAVRAAVRSIARERFDAAAIAADLLRSLRFSREALGALRERWESLEFDAQQALLAELGGESNSSGSWLDRSLAVICAEPFRELGWSLDKR